MPSAVHEQPPPPGPSPAKVASVTWLGSRSWFPFRPYRADLLVAVPAERICAL